MKSPNEILRFTLGGTGYVAMELLWRGWSHPSMFLLGGSCFLLLGKLNRVSRPLPLGLRALAGAGIVTGMELVWGLAFNRNYAVWDYRNLPFSFQGQICMPYSLLWIPVSALALKIDGLLYSVPVGRKLSGS